MAIYALIRETMDWPNARNEQLHERIRPIAQIWDATFNLSFGQCRALIKEVTYARLRRLVGDRLLTVPAPAITLEESDILVICDDDDWYSPDLPEQLHRCGLADGLMAIWPDAIFGFNEPFRQPHAPVEPFLGPLRLRPLNLTNVVSTVKTNNYALAGRFFSGQPLSEAVGPVLTHATAIGTLAPIYMEKRVGVVEPDLMLSVVNRHPCSNGVIWRSTVGVGNPTAEALRTLVRQFVSGVAPDRFQPELTWAVEPAQAMVEIFRRALGNE